MNIEDSIFTPAPATNPIPVINRLSELMKESKTNDPEELMKDQRIKRTVFLLCTQFKVPLMYDLYADLLTERLKEGENTYVAGTEFSGYQSPDGGYTKSERSYE